MFETSLSLALRVIIFYLLAVELGKFLGIEFIGPVNLSFLDPIRTYVQERFLNSAFLRIYTCGWTILSYFVWLKTVDKYRQIPNAFNPSTSRLRGYLKGLAIGGSIILFTYFMDQILGFLKIDTVIATPKQIMANIFVVWVLSSFTSCMEEVLFRGYFLELFSKKWNAHVACLIQAILFGAIHLNGGRGIYIFLSTGLAGLLLGYTYLIFRNVYVCIAIHTTFHLSNLLTSNKIFKFHPQCYPSFFSYFQANCGFFGIVGILITITILICTYQKMDLTKKLIDRSHKT